VTELKTTTPNTWSNTQAFALAGISLLLGLCGGWLIRKSAGMNGAENAQVVSAPTAAPAPVVPVQGLPTNMNPQMAQPSPTELKQAADSQAAPMLEQLKTDSNNAALLAQVGNIYYDVKAYPTAIEYYERSLQVQPSDSSVRTDMGTAYWYTGDADKAIAEFNKALTYEPNKSDALFNLGIVKWQGKKDGPGAVAAWQKLLETNPGYSGKDNVLQLIAQAQGH
jgi:cytochrome c-type biogenesis protein CcmH/NrfG